MADQCKVMHLLDGVGTQHGEAGAAAGHHVAVVAEDRQGMGGDGAGGDMEDRRQQFAGNLVHVGDHQQQALRRGEGRSQRPALQGAVYRAGSAGLALHLDDLRDRAPEIGPRLAGPCIHEITHRRGRRDRIDGQYFAELVGNRRAGRIAVSRDHQVSGSFSPGGELLHVPAAGYADGCLLRIKCRKSRSTACRSQGDVNVPFVVTENCINCKHTSCAAVCPADCFHEGPNFLVIDPDACIDCIYCVPACPVGRDHGGAGGPPESAGISSS